MSRKGKGVSLSSNAFNYSKMTTSSVTKSNKFSSTTTNSYDKRIFNRSGQLVASSTSTQINTTSNLTSGIIGSTLSIIFALLLIVNFYSVFLMETGEFRGLEWLFKVFENAPAIETDWLEAWGQMKITEDWGAFNFLANFLNKFNGFLNICAFLGIGCINILTFILYFVGAFLFAGF